MIENESKSMKHSHQFLETYSIMMLSNITSNNFIKDNDSFAHSIHSEFDFSILYFAETNNFSDHMISNKFFR